MDALTAALGSVLNRLSDFFDMFDLSFFVSGGTFVLAVAVWLGHFHPGTASFGQWAIIAGGLLAYVAGLGCFAVGRPVRRVLFGPWAKLDGVLPSLLDGDPDARPTLGLAVASHLRSLGLDDDPRFASAFEQDGRPVRWRDGRPEAWNRELDERFGRLYARLWGELRETAADGAGFRLIRSYWVRAATLDGLVVAFGAWWWVGWKLAPTLGSGEAGLFAGRFGITVAAVIVVLFLMHEASRFDRYQLEELVGLYAVERDRQRLGGGEVAKALRTVADAALVDEVVAAAVGARLPRLVGRLVDAVRRDGGVADEDALRAAAAVVLHERARRIAEQSLAELATGADPTSTIRAAVTALRSAWSDGGAVVAAARNDPRLAVLSASGGAASPGV